MKKDWSKGVLGIYKGILRYLQRKFYSSTNNFFPNLFSGSLQILRPPIGTGPNMIVLPRNRCKNKSKFVSQSSANSYENIILFCASIKLVVKQSESRHLVFVYQFASLPTHPTYTLSALVDWGSRHVGFPLRGTGQIFFTDNVRFSNILTVVHSEKSNCDDVSPWLEMNCYTAEFCRHSRIFTWVSFRRIQYILVVYYLYTINFALVCNPFIKFTAEFLRGFFLNYTWNKQKNYPKQIRLDLVGFWSMLHSSLHLWECA